jgi:hypothetical protein
MSGPVEPSAGRAVNANQAPLGEYAADWPTSTTFWAIWTAPFVFGDELTATDGVGVKSGGGLGVTSGGVGVAVASGVGVGFGGLGVFVGAVGVGVGVTGGGEARSLGVGVGAADAGGVNGTTEIEAA